MSLINDALKRASQTQPPPLADSATGTPMRPIESKRPSVWPLVVVPVVLVFILAVAGWFLLKGLAAGQKAVLARELPAENVTRPETVPDAAQTPGTAKNPAALPSPKNRANPKPGQTSSPRDGVKNPQNASKEDASVPETAEPGFPSLRLQGLFYRSTRSSVIINSKTLSVGDRIQDATVIAIERDSVVVEWEGEKRVLTLN